MRIITLHGSAMVAKIIKLILEDAGHDVIVTQSPGGLTEELAEHETHAVIIGVDPGKFDSLKLCKEVRASGYTGPVIFISHENGLEDKLSAFRNGADDYIIEPFEPEEFLARVEATARRCRHIDNQPLGAVINVDDAELSIGDMTFHRKGEPPISLTPTEMRLLERLMRNTGLTISRDTLIERTWGYEYFGDSNRVDVYIARLRKKIEPDPAKPRYLHTVRGAGYVFRVREPRGVVAIVNDIISPEMIVPIAAPFTRNPAAP